MSRMAVAVGLVAGLLFLGAASAQPGAGRVMERVAVAPVAGGLELTIRLPFPVQVLDSFPGEPAALFAVRLQPLGLQGEERVAASTREIRSPRDPGRSPVVEVIYDGEMFGGPYLLVVFDRPVSAGASPSGDARGVVISVRDPRDGPAGTRHGGR